MTLAESRDRVLAFNYASQAMNNSFFLDMLVSFHDAVYAWLGACMSRGANDVFSRASQKAPDPSKPAREGIQGHEHEIVQRERLAAQIDADFGSLTALKSAFSAAAMGMVRTTPLSKRCDLKPAAHLFRAS